MKPIISTFLLALFAVAVTQRAVPMSDLWGAGREQPEVIRQTIPLTTAYRLWKERRATFVDVRTVETGRRRTIKGAIAPEEVPSDAGPNFVIFGYGEDLGYPLERLQSLHLPRSEAAYVMEGGFAAWAALDLPSDSK